MLFLEFHLYLSLVVASIHPISIVGRKFVDNITNEPFYIKGVDYQPGGSSAALQLSDPLSDPEVCARDIALFQKLRINTIRVYNIDSSLNHDQCMTMLATAGIYLVLDVNSPVKGHHLNRYEPWTTYTKEYMRNVFSVVHQFSTYNNTLAFIAGNEVVNDLLSASKSPVYVKAVIRDIKQYIRSNSPRIIPVGYSAADDLNYRVSLASYLECSTKDSTESVDFYGVNSYQWCGEQTFYTSGYNALVDAYKSYSKPIFFSEYGCNTISPRRFGEMKTIYSEEMSRVFSGGLIYEFTEEPNNYGLVKVLSNNDVQLLPDFHYARKQFSSLSDGKKVPTSRRKPFANANNETVSVKCVDHYLNIHTTKSLPPSPALELIHRGIRGKAGQYVRLSDSSMKSPFKVLDVDGNSIYLEKPKVESIHNVIPTREFQSGTYHSTCSQENVVSNSCDEVELDDSCNGEDCDDFCYSEMSSCESENYQDEKPLALQPLRTWLKKISNIFVKIFDTK